MEINYVMFFMFAMIFSIIFHPKFESLGENVKESISNLLVSGIFLPFLLLLIFLSFVFFQTFGKYLLILYFTNVITGFVFKVMNKFKNKNLNMKNEKNT